MLTEEQVLKLRQQVGIPAEGVTPVKTIPQAQTAESRIAKLKAGIPTIDQSPPDPTFLERTITKNPVAQSYIDLGKGLGKGVLATGRSLGQIGETVLNQTAGRAVNALQGKGFTPTESPNSIYNPESEAGKKAIEVTTPHGLDQNIGFFGEKALEFLAPATAAAKGEKYIDLLSNGINNPVLAAGARVIGKAGVQAIAAGGTTLAQTASPKKALQAAEFAGVIRGGMATIGEGVKALHIPERLYSTIFKNNYRDMQKEFTSGTILKLQQTNPDKFQSLVDAGIINVGRDGAPIMNESLAKEALDRGLKGSARAMAESVIEGTFDSEHAARQIATNYEGTVDLTEPQFQNILQKIGVEYEDVGFGEISSEANGLANKLKQGSGNVDAETALDVRRLLDKARIASSFERPASSLSMTQSNLKTLADTARARINAVPGMGEVMKEYSFQIEALDALSREAARTQNRQLISLIDSIFVGGGLVGGEPTSGTALILLRRLLSHPGVMTGGAQVLQNSTIGTLGSTVLEGASSGAANAITDGQ